jgi:ethanolamine utilization protein EutQ
MEPAPASLTLIAAAPSFVHIQEGLDHDLKKKVRKILEETLKPACPNPQALHVRGDQVVIQPFDQAPPGQRIGLTDVVTAKEGNLCAGFMTFDHSKLPWLLNYDEADYIIEGDFVLKVGDKVFQAKAGDVVYIPKGSQVIFSSPTFCKVFYVTYPANWTDFCG